MRHIAVFCGSHKGKNPHFQSAAQRLGQLIAMQGRTLIYGGSNFGYMGVVSEAAMQAGGYVVGVIPTLFSDEVIQSQRVSELVKVASMAERKEVIIQRADAFGCMELMTAHGKQVDVHFMALDFHVSHCLYRVGMKQCSGFMCDFGDFINRLDCSDLVVCHHYGNKKSIGRHQFPQIFYFDPSLFVNRCIFDIESEMGKHFRGI